MQIKRTKILYVDDRPVAANIPNPPGDCKPSDQRRLQDDVDKYCKTIGRH